MEERRREQAGGAAVAMAAVCARGFREGEERSAVLRIRGNGEGMRCRVPGV
jgi:hypothetical protein